MEYLFLAIFFLNCASHLNNVRALRYIQKELDVVEHDISILEQSLSKEWSDVKNDSLEILYTKRKHLLNDKFNEEQQAKQNYQDDIDGNLFITGESQKKALKKR